MRIIAIVISLSSIYQLSSRNVNINPIFSFNQQVCAAEHIVEFFSDSRVLWLRHTTTFVSYKQFAVLCGSTIGNIIEFGVLIHIFFKLVVINSDQDEWIAGECIPGNVLEVFRCCDNAIGSVAGISMQW